MSAAGALALHLLLLMSGAWVRHEPPRARFARGATGIPIVLESDARYGGGESDTRDDSAAASTADPALDPPATVKVVKRSLRAAPPVALSRDELVQEAFGPDSFLPAPRLGTASRQRLLEAPAASTPTLGRGSGRGQGAGQGAGPGGFGGLFEHSGSGHLKAELCFLPPGTRTIRHLAECNDLGQTYVAQINIPQRSFAAGFPGARDPRRTEFFAVRYVGVFSVSQRGEHAFRLLSDDGSQLFIDHELILSRPPRRARAAAIRHAAGAKRASLHRPSVADRAQSP